MKIPYTSYPETAEGLHPTPLTLSLPKPVLSEACPEPAEGSKGATPYTLHPTPYTLHPTPYTLDPNDAIA